MPSFIKVSVLLIALTITAAACSQSEPPCEKILGKCKSEYDKVKKIDLSNPYDKPYNTWTEEMKTKYSASIDKHGDALRAYDGPLGPWVDKRPKDK